ncbi:MAG: hypothetical protein IJ407_05340 [Clostridia bacterium]|nr:hypothetical protein [Clostridia bacterium]
MKTILDIIKPALLDAVNRHLFTMESQDPEYQQWVQKYNGCWEQIKKALPKERQRELMKLEDLRNQQISMEYEEIYMCGMRDAIALLKAFQVI